MRLSVVEHDPPMVDGEPSRGRRGLLYLLFALYLVLLTWIVMWKLEVPYEHHGFSGADPDTGERAFYYSLEL